MDKREESVLSTITRLRTTVSQNQTSVNSIPALRDGFEELFLIGDDLTLKVGLQNANIKGFTKEKKEVKLLLTEETMIVAGAVYNYALKVENTALATEMNITASGVFKLKDEIIVPIVTKVYDAAKLYLTDLADFGMNQAKLNAYKAIIDDFAAKRQIPKAEISVKHSQTAAIDNLCEKAKFILDEKLDKLMLQLKKSDPEFYDTYLSARKIEKTGSKKQKNKAEEVLGIVNITVTDAESKLAIEGAEANIENTDLTDMSDEDGLLYFDSVPLGKVNITISADGYVDLHLLNLEITADTELSLDYEMVAVS
jgi:hypothetical protein